MTSAKRLLIFVFAIVLLSTRASAQPRPVTNPIGLRPIPWAWYDPYYAITSRIHAQAELIRAQGDVAVDFAQARVLHAKAVDQELDNWVKQVRGYWDRKIIRENKRLDLEHLSQLRKDQHLDREKYRNSRVWNRLKNHPELTQISEGKALNFLLQRLSATALAYDFVHEGDDADVAYLPELHLTKSQLHSLNLRQRVSGDKDLVFRADGSSELDLQWWPFLLREKKFARYRVAFEAARDSVFRDVDKTTDLEVAKLQQLETSLGELSRAFYGVFGPEWMKAADFASFLQFQAAESFLRRLDALVLRLQNTGRIDVFRTRSDDAAELAGDDLVSLLTYMTRNGFDFAAALPGDEPAYHSVFAMMRDLYVAVADNDDSIKPPHKSTPDG